MPNLPPEVAGRKGAARLMSPTLLRWLEEDIVTREELLRYERKLGLIRKWALHLGGLSLLVLLYPAWFNVGFRALTALFLAAAAAYTAYLMWLARPGNIRTGWYLSYVEDAFFVSCLIYYGGGLTSEFVLLYPFIMIGVAASRLRMADFLLTGLIGHLSFAVGMYFHYRSAEFYLTAAFWDRCLLITGSFLVSLVIVEAISRDKEELRRSKEELERTARQLEASNAKLEALAVTDGLTGLYNHRYFQQRLREEIQRAERYESTLCLAMLDVDYFKCYNDTHGHPRGDEILVEVARLIRENIRGTDVAARYGGEEFAIIFVEMDMAVAEEVAERLRRAIEAFEFPGEECQPGGRLTVSIGLACYPGDAATADELIKKADEALYRAKRLRRNVVVAYHSVLEDLKRLEAAPPAGAAEEDDTVLETIEAVLMAIDQKDRYTHGHAERTMRYAEALARKLGLPEERVRLVKYAAFIHDIGKLKIPKEILNKSRPLTEEERQIIKLHSLYGVGMIEPLQNLQRVIPIIKHHHERYDGTGYPDGLKGEEIDLEARILALADAFDAMRSARPYRGPMTLQEAIEEVKRGAGTQFDPKLVDAFIEAVREVEGLNGGKRNSA